MRELRKFLSAVLLIGGAGSLLTGEAALFGAVLGLLSLAVWPWSQKKSNSATDIQKIENQQNIEALSKARTDYATIREGIPHIPDRTMAAQLNRLQLISGKMLEYLSSHQQRIPAASRFIDYYQDRTATLVQQYLTLQETGMQTEAAERLLQDMRKTFQGFAIAYEQEFAKVLNHEVMDMEAELKVARQVMQGEGINCDELEIKEPEAPQVQAESKEENGWNLKTAGLAVGAVVLGAVGLWKMFGEGEKK